MGDRAAWRRRGKRIGLALALATATIAMGGFVVLPPIARHVAEKQLSELLGREVKIDKVRMNPFALSLTVDGFRILEGDRSQTFVGFSRLYVNAELSSLFRRAPVVRELRLESPRVRVVRTRATAGAFGDLGAAYNFSDILARLAARATTAEPSPAETAPEPGLPRFALGNIQILDGAVTFEDQPLGERHALTGLTVGVPFVSTLPVYLDAFVEPYLRVAVDGTPFEAAGQTKPFHDSLETVLELRLRGLDLARYMPFVPVPLGFSVDSARLSLDLNLAFVRRGETPSLVAAGDVALDGLALRERRPDGLAPLLTLEKVAIVIGRSDITAQRFTIDRVSVSGLELYARRLADGTLGFQRLLPSATADGGRPRSGAAAKKRAAAPAQSAPPPKAEGGLRFTVGEIAVEKTRILFQDESVRPIFTSVVGDIALSVKGLSNEPGVLAQTSARLRAVPGGTVRHEGTLRLAPLAVRGTIAIEDVEPGRLSPYYRDRVALDVTRGRLRFGAEYSLDEGRAAPTVRVAKAFLEIADLGLRRRGAREDFLRLPAFSARGGTLDLGNRSLAVEEISTRAGRLRAARDAQGVVDVTTLVTPSPAEKAPVRMPAERAPQPAPEGTPQWTLAVGHLAIDKWSARFEDRALPTRAVVMLDPIALDVKGFSTTPGSKLDLDLRVGINRTGRLEIKGSGAVEPLAASLRFDLRRLDLVPFGPYLQPHLALTITGGKMSLRGRSTISRRPGREVDVDASADLEVADVATVDRDHQEPLVGWGSLRATKIRFSSRPSALAVGEVALADLDARLIAQPGGTLNLAKALAPPAKTGAAGRPAAAKTSAPGTGGKPAEAEPAMRVTIGKVSLERNQISFQDRTVEPPFAAEIEGLRGHVAGLSSTPGTTAELDLQASVNRTGALSIAGKLNPLAKDLYVDVAVTVRDVELPPATPYSGKYVGLTIRKGKLGLALNYEIAHRTLSARNQLLIDQLAFGEKVASPTATKLPVRLAVALLRDRHGLIDVTLPVEGSLDDPEFKVWRAALKVITNLLVKAAVSPFSLVAAAFGGGDELSQIDFAAGASELEATGRKRVATLAKVLQERPGLSFELAGHADPKQDGEGLKRFLVERKLKARKLAALVDEGISVASLDAIAIEPTERERFAREAYDAETFDKPRNALGFKKRLPLPEMERLMVANTRVSDDDLRALALRRATVVQAALTKAAPGTSGRVFLVSPQVSGNGGHVELKLKN